MSKSRKESRQFYLSVEGINCEKLYFEHLKKLINSCEESRFKVQFDIKPQISPKSMYKRIGHKPVDRYGKKRIPYMHVQDIEDYRDSERRKKFENTIDEIRYVEKCSGVPYLFGYSNYTFELWMLLHVADMHAPLANRKQYLTSINRFFHRDYKKLSEYKAEKEFSGILKEYITLDSVKKAIGRAAALRLRQNDNGYSLTNYRNFKFYKENPDTTVDQIVKLIFDICEITY